METFNRIPLLLLLAVTLTVVPIAPTAASSRHLHALLRPQENDYMYTNISQLNPNVTANLIDGCWYKPINFTKYENQVEAYVSSFYEKLLNGALLPGGKNITVVRLADGTLSIINGNVSVSETGLLIVNGVLTKTGVYNGTLLMNQTLPNITTLVTSVLQEAENLTKKNSTLGNLLGGVLGNLPPIPGLNLSGGLPSIVYNPGSLVNETKLFSYSPVSPDAIMEYLKNLTAATLSSLSAGSIAGQDSGPLNRARATPVPTVAQGANMTLPGFPVIKVYFWVIVARQSDNDVTQTMLVDQIAKMNKDYAGTPFQFALAGAAKIVNAQWVDRNVDTEEAVFNRMKTRTRMGGPQDLNAWVLTFSDDGLNGYATFPWDFADSPRTDGIVISKYTLPMSTKNRNYQALRSVGITLTHETGHWIGLFHTFQGGCIGPGDFVADTVPEGTPNDYSNPKCNTHKYSCPQLGRNQPPDPIFNFMNYGACREQFTPGQIARMKQYWTYYRYNQG